MGERKRKADVSLQQPQTSTKEVNRNRPLRQLRVFLCHPSNYSNEKTGTKGRSNECRFEKGDAVHCQLNNSENNNTTSFAGVFQTQTSDHKSTILLPQLMDKDATGRSSSKEIEVETRRLVPLYDNDCTSQSEDKESTSLIVTPTTARFRQLARSLSAMQQQHHVLEAGCSTGQTSQILISHGKSWVGFDTSPEMIRTVQKCIPNSDRELSVRVDALINPHVAQQAASTFADKGPSIVFLDIGGNREGLAVLNMIDFCLFHLHHVRQIFVKNEALFENLLQQQEEASATPSSSNKEVVTVKDIPTWLQQQRSFFSNVSYPVCRTSDNPSVSVPFSFPKHPLKAPLRLSPVDHKTPICRFHNYDRKGCSKWSGRPCNHGSEDACPYDHEHCHFCLEAGHVALDCPSRPVRQQTEST